MLIQQCSICSRCQRWHLALPASWYSGLQHADIDGAQCTAHHLQWELAQ